MRHDEFEQPLGLGRIEPLELVVAHLRSLSPVRNRRGGSYQGVMTDIDDVIRLLQDRRPEATELELDEIKQRVLRRAAQPRRAQPMKSRLAIPAMLVLGFVFCTAGVV